MTKKKGNNTTAGDIFGGGLGGAYESDSDSDWDDEGYEIHSSKLDQNTVNDIRNSFGKNAIGIKPESQVKKILTAPKKLDLGTHASIKDAASARKQQVEAHKDYKEYGFTSIDSQGNMSDKNTASKESELKGYTKNEKNNQELQRLVEARLQRRAALEGKTVEQIRAEERKNTDKQPTKVNKLDKALQPEKEHPPAGKLSENNDLMKSSKHLLDFFNKKVAPVAREVLVACDEAIKTAGKVTDELLHDTTVPEKNLRTVSKKCTEAATEVQIKTDKLEKFITDDAENHNLAKPQKTAIQQLVVIGESVVLATQEKAHAVDAAIQRNQAIEDASMALAKVKYMKEKQLQATAKTFKENYNKNPALLKIAEEMSRRAIEDARAELTRAHMEATANERALKKADEEAKRAAQKAAEDFKIAKRTFGI